MKDKIINILGTSLDADQQTLENIADEILLLFGVSNNEACEADLDVVVTVPNYRITTYALKKKDSEVTVCPEHLHQKMYDENKDEYYCEICEPERQTDC